MKQACRAACGLFSILLLLHLGGCSATNGIQPSQAMCVQFLQKMQGHQFTAAYKLLNKDCKAVTTQQQMQNYWDLVEKNRGPVQSIVFQNFSIFASTGGSHITNNYGLVCKNGRSAVTFTCVEENGAWLIQGFNFTG